MTADRVGAAAPLARVDVDADVDPDLGDDAAAIDELDPADPALSFDDAVAAIPPPVPWARGTRPDAPVRAGALPTVEDIYDRHAPFVFRVLRGLGVGDDRVDDAVQDVFIVVHRRLPEFEARSSVTTWLYAIARRVASQHRRSAARGAPAPDADPDDMPCATTPYDDAKRHQAARVLAELLAELDDDKREVFALIELEQMSAPDVAAMLGIPVNTVYSRLRLARARFELALARRVAREVGR